MKNEKMPYGKFETIGKARNRMNYLNEIFEKTTPTLKFTIEKIDQNTILYANYHGEVFTTFEKLSGFIRAKVLEYKKSLKEQA